VFLSNLPRDRRHAGLLRGGWDRGRIIRLWLIVVAASAIAAFVGGSVLAGFGGELHAFILGFAGGAILTMLADTLIPEAFDHAGKQAGLMTTLGFGLSFAPDAAGLAPAPAAAGLAPAPAGKSRRLTPRSARRRC
jgi:ZIP family zinc transporter